MWLRKSCFSVDSRDRVVCFLNDVTLNCNVELTALLGDLRKTLNLKVLVYKTGYVTSFNVMKDLLLLGLSDLWSSGQSSWQQIRRPGFDSRHCQKKK
jgi:hypothetical protein